MIISGSKIYLVNIKLILLIFRLALKYFKKPGSAIKYTFRLIVLRSKIYGNKQIIKLATNGKLYFYTSDIPGWPSQAYKDYIFGEFKRQVYSEITENPLQTAIISITSQCPLSCIHCYESKYIGSGIQLTIEHLNKIIAQLYENGVRHIQLSGGEPLSRFADLISILEKHSTNMQFWILTSGYGLDKEKASKLKRAGLTGVHISLDHYDEVSHNTFRGNPRSFQQAINAVENCRQAQLLVSLSLTATAENICHDFLQNYWEFARLLKVDFVRILEARAVGGFAGKNVKLDEDQISVIIDFYLKSLVDKLYLKYPIIDFPGYHQQRSGCFGAGDRYLYIDSAGNFHACPFCQNAAGNIDTMNLNDARKWLQSKKCHAYHQANI